MNSKSHTSNYTYFPMEGRTKAMTDGISENALNLALFALCVLFLGLSMVSSSMSLYEMEVARLESQTTRIKAIDSNRAERNADYALDGDILALAASHSSWTLTRHASDLISPNTRP